MGNASITRTEGLIGASVGGRLVLSPTMPKIFGGDGGAVSGLGHPLLIKYSFSVAPAS